MVNDKLSCGNAGTLEQLVLKSSTADLVHHQFINSTYVTGFVKIDPNHTGTEIYFIAEH